MAGRGWASVWRAVCAAAVLLAASGAGAAELSGVALPDTSVVSGVPLRLNGIGLRTYSLLRIHIYVAGLYVQRPSHDAEAILHSPEEKMMVFHFIHDVDAEDARKSWQEGFEDNCLLPCRIAPDDEARFLAAVPPMRAGDSSIFVFAPGRLTVMVNGRVVGTITNPTFAWAVLATFLGPKPPTEALKRGLLGDGG